MNVGIRRIASFLWPQNATPEEAQGELHPFEKTVKGIGEHFLHLDPSDPRPKVLWLVASYDDNGALNPRDNFEHLYRLHDLTDVKYQVIKHSEELCNAIQAARKVGNLQSVILNAHGSPFSIVLSLQHSISILQSLPQDCFAGMPEDAKIFLASCSGGSGLVPLNIAEWLAWESGKSVTASRGYTSSEGTLLRFVNGSKVDIDFCHFTQRGSYTFTQDKCHESMTRIFHPPITILEKSVLFSKIGLPGLVILFLAYQLNRVALDSLFFHGRSITDFAVQTGSLI
jgi:hypothetical protein